MCKSVFWLAERVKHIKQESQWNRTDSAVKKLSSGDLTMYVYLCVCYRRLSGGAGEERETWRQSDEETVEAAANHGVASATGEHA